MGTFPSAIGTRYINPLTQNHSSLLLDQTDPLLKDEKKKDRERETVALIYLKLP